MVEIIPSSLSGKPYADILKCSPWYTNRTYTIYQLSIIWDGEIDHKFWNDSEKLRIFALTDVSMKCGEVDISTSGGTFVTVLGRLNSKGEGPTIENNNNH